jgi:hypothetical protein
MLVVRLVNLLAESMEYLMECN